MLFVLSILYIVPQYLSGGLGGFILSLVTDTEPEGRFVGSIFHPLVWTLIPLTSIGLCVMSWVTYSMEDRSTKMFRELAQLSGALLFVASFLPAILVVHKLLVDPVFGFASSNNLAVLSNFVLVMNDTMNPTLILGRRSVWVVPLVIFMETGLFFGFFLPGDSILFTIGVLGYFGHVDLPLLIILSILAAIAGDQLGYAIGRRAGQVLINRYRFAHDNMQRASEFYSKHGGKAIIFARFVPVVRSFAPVVAGAAGMRYSRFTISNITGGILWVLGVTLAGYFAGGHIPHATEYLSPLLLVVILGSPLVWMFTWLWSRTKKKQLAHILFNLRLKVSHKKLKRRSFEFFQLVH